MSDALATLQSELKQAQRQVDLLCTGFGVKLSPSWDEIINDVIENIKTHKKQISPPYVFFSRNFSLADTIPRTIFNQFREKFLTIVRECVLPAIKKYKDKNPDIDVNVFKPLLTVKI